MEEIDDFLISIISRLAIGFGWSKNDILALYIDEAMEYAKEIEKHKLSDYLMQLNIVSNPNSKKPKLLFSEIKNALRRIDFKVENESMTKADEAKLKQLFKRKCSK